MRIQLCSLCCLVVYCPGVLVGVVVVVTDGVPVTWTSGVAVTGEVGVTVKVAAGVAVIKPLVVSKTRFNTCPFTPSEPRSFWLK